MHSRELMAVYDVIETKKGAGWEHAHEICGMGR